MGKPPAGFVPIDEVAPAIVVEARYAGFHNFLGRPVAGYHANRCWLSRPAAESLARVQKDAEAQGLTLKVYDCYRPQRAVNDFIAWAREVSDQKTKAEFYPRVDKRDVFKLGYVASRSGHSRGSTVDLTLVKLPIVPQRAYRDGEKLVDCAAPKTKRFPDNGIDMGTGYDCFDPLSATDAATIPDEAKANRRLLKRLMEKHGFRNYEAEWWHYTLRDEPYPDNYFDFEVK